MSDIKNITGLPLNFSARFPLNGKNYVQLGNAAKCEIMVMPAETPEDFELIKKVQSLWNKPFKISGQELKLINYLYGNSAHEITRRSEKEFDLNICGEGGDEFSIGKFRAWLPLACLRKTDWTCYADMSDYPEMVIAGDWSGIRDSSEEKIWAMFEKENKNL